jgi:hypothetical protein
MSQAPRGVLYLVWGDRAEKVQQRSLASLREVHPELPFHCVRLPANTDPCAGLFEKARMLEISPFEETLFLDADTVVIDRLDFGFAQARRFGLACCICECPWTRRYTGMPKDDGVEYNTGVLFFTRGAAPVFDRWRALVSEIDSSIRYMVGDQGFRMPHNDQAAFARAVQEWERLPFILPLNWNFRPEWHSRFFGPLKIWHDYNDPPPSLKQLAHYYRDPEAIVGAHSIGKA